ncbi:ABC transporter ATP-binding protein [uncultured Enterovirga sp.]|uniref:ABC transporter ATP-binding protein n=1 Tax=uncultured Enterovirga sp. TaxID=2026352 RepID=UPI0035CB861B
MTLELASVSKSFDGLRVLTDVSLSVPEGGVFGLIGPNGAGKSTLFALVTGHQSPDSGQIAYRGESLGRTSASQRARKGLIRTFQVPREFTNLTVRENLMAAAPDQAGEGLLNLFFRPGLVARDERRVGQEADERLAFLRLAHVADVPAGRLSGGQKKLLELGRALMARPTMILLDEPFAGVNPVLVEQIIDRLQALAESGIGLFVIEHNLEALARLVPRMAVLDRGVVIADGSPAKVLADERVREAYLGGGPA